MDPLRADTLTIRVDEPQGRIRLFWQGKSDARDPGVVLKPYFDQLIGEATMKKATVEMHFEQLEHFNSSTIAVLVQCINQAKGAGVPMVISYDAKLRWQTLSFEGLGRALKPFQQEGGNVQFVPAATRPGA